MADNTAIPASGEDTFRSVYADATYFIDSIVQEYGAFQTILDRMKRGEATVELRKRYLLRAIDETWVNIIEDTLPALDVIIRNPSRFIEEREEIVSADQIKKVSVRTLQHLSQHTNFIQRIEGDRIIPKQLLNVYKEETFQTYENKFVNTLINRLYIFVNRRYEIALNAGQDEKTTSIEFNDNFDHDKVKVKMNFRVEISEVSDGLDDKVERNYSYTTDLWRRVVRLNDIVTSYADSDFVRMMGKSYIRPPVMRTNAILKNKNLRQCLELWRFIESYESAGYSMLIQENLESIDEDYLKELYSTLALQYMIFRYNIRNEFEIDSTLDSELTSDELKPKIIDRLGEISEREFDINEPGEERFAEPPSGIRYATLTPEDQILLESLDVAMDAAQIIRDNGEEFIYSGGEIPEPEPEPEPVIEPEPEPEAEPEDESKPEAAAETEPETEPEQKTESAESAEPSDAPAETAEAPEETAEAPEDVTTETVETPAEEMEEAVVAPAGEVAATEPETVTETGADEAQITEEDAARKELDEFEAAVAEFAAMPLPDYEKAYKELTSGDGDVNE